MFGYHAHTDTRGAPLTTILLVQPLACEPPLLPELLELLAPPELLAPVVLLAPPLLPLLHAARAAARASAEAVATIDFVVMGSFRVG